MKRKSEQQKKNTNSCNLPIKQQSMADQLSFVPPAGLPEPPALLDDEPEATEIYYNLGSALMKYEQLYQNIDSYTLALASTAYRRFSLYNKVAMDPEQAIIREKKSHCAIDPETGTMPVTLKEHPAVKLARDAQTDFT